jgi:hypothetical protein
MKIKKHSGVISTLLFSIITSFGILLMTPLILQNYGQNIYIVWSISNSICALLFIFDFGITSVASQKFLGFFKNTGIFSKDSWTTFLRLHSTILLSASLLLLIIFSFQISFQNNLQTSINSVVIFLITMFSTLATIVCHQQVVKYQIKENYHLALITLTVTKIIETFLVLLLLYIQVDFITVCTSILLVRCLQFLMLKQFSKKIFAENNINSHKKLVFKPSIFFGPILYSTSSVLGIHATFLLQSIFLNPHQTVTVLITRMLASPIRILADSLAIGNFDKFLNKPIPIPNSESSLKKRVLIREYWVLILFTVPYTLSANVFGNDLVDFLSKGQLQVNYVLLNLFCLSTVLDGLIVLFMQFRISKGMHYGLGMTYLTTTITGLILLLICIPYIDLYAGAVSIIFCNLLFMSHRLFSKGSKNEN